MIFSAESRFFSAGDVVAEIGATIEPGGVRDTLAGTMHDVIVNLA